MTPRATLRLQFHKGFTFSDALPHIDYFRRLGISHIYSSPFLKARSGSIHGYDIVDHTEVNPELGGETGLRRLVSALRQREIGFIADIVPNHMCVSDNGSRWWLDVLQWGQESSYARFFDIDWHPPDRALHNKVHMPFLGRPYGYALADGELMLDFDPVQGRFLVGYHDNFFPLTPRSYGAILRIGAQPALEPFMNRFDRLSLGAPAQVEAGEAMSDLARAASDKGISDAIDMTRSAFDAKTTGGFKNLHELLEAQNYRLAWWRTAADEINWRRFFDISDLAGLRVERPDVFEATHALIFKLYAEGWIDGVRVDHVDGLADPRTYCRRLRRCLDALASRRPDGLARDRPWIIVEKILATGERLATDWLVDGTTGYDFMNAVSGVLHDARGEAPLTTMWTDLTGRRSSFQAVAETTRRLILQENLHSELYKTADALHKLARHSPSTRDYTLPALRNALTEVLVKFPVYRSYTTLAGRAPGDAALLETAISAARQILPEVDHRILELIDGWLGGRIGTARTSRVLQRDAIASFQQLTSALTAKAVEDTAFYRYGRLISRNEVGSNPGEFALGRDEFHAACTERARNFPSALLATATHDHKRGEDARMRIATLSEIPTVWEDTVRRWMRLNAPFRASLADIVAPEPADELILYETLIGSWPIDADPSNEEWLASFRDRILGWQMKATREAKRRSRWIAPDEAYEKAASAFVGDILDNAKSGTFLSELGRFVAGIGPAAAVNSLTQTFLRMTTPGVPDLYQGTDYWDLSLVDPDNRRPVDFAARAATLSRSDDMTTMLASWKDGRVKQGLIAKTLHARSLHGGIFNAGAYQPLALEGEAAAHVLAFARIAENGARVAVMLATRLPTRLIDDGGLPHVSADRWGDTTLLLPADIAGRFVEHLTDVHIDATGGRLMVGDALARLPVALLIRKST